MVPSIQFMFFFPSYINLFVFAGVVFNEMKGVYSQPDNILGRTAQQVSLLSSVYLYLLHFDNFVAQVVHSLSKFFCQWSQ